MVKPTAQQNEIINYAGNIAVVARPGSGKTFVLSKKIKLISDSNPEYKGVIAISFTNKASRELKDRSIREGTKINTNFFGTIHAFALVEIIIPFGKHVFDQLGVTIDFNTVTNEEAKLATISKDTDWENLSSHELKELKSLYCSGTIPIDLIGEIALYLVKHSPACQKYLRARYTHIIIDEYQDSQESQHKLFLFLHDLGLVAIAVGDINQSIYAFAGGKSDYLFALTQLKYDFTTFDLDKNHRSNSSIVKYSNKLINVEDNEPKPTDNKILLKKVDGNEVDIAKWLDKAIPHFKQALKVSGSEIAILTRSARTARVIDENLTHDSKFLESTPIEQDLSLWSTVFSKTLSFLFDKNQYRLNLVEQFFNYDLDDKKAKKCISLLDKIVESHRSQNTNLINDFIELADCIYPKAKSDKSIQLLDATLRDETMLAQFYPVEADQVQIMTMHKSKGLEFKLVIHLDLYQYVFPAWGSNPVTGQFEIIDYVQDLNLHYVAVTRAKELCILCTSTKRTNAKGETKEGKISEFFKHNNIQLEKLFSKCPI